MPTRVAILISAVAFAIAVPAGSVSAQQPGDTVRVSGDLVAVVLGADSAGLYYSGGYAPFAGMRSLELWGGTTRLTGRGFRYGLIAGSVAGGFVMAAGAMMGGSETTTSDYFGLAGVGALVTLFCGWVGALIGSGIEGEVWIPVPVPGGLE